MSCTINLTYPLYEYKRYGNTVENLDLRKDIHFRKYGDLYEKVRSAYLKEEKENFIKQQKLDAILEKKRLRRTMVLLSKPSSESNLTPENNPSSIVYTKNPLVQ